MSKKMKIDQDALKGPDAFVSTSDKILNFIAHHFKTFMTIVIAALVAAVVYVGTGYFNSAKEAKAAEMLYAPEAELKKVETDSRAKKAEGLIPKKGEKPVEEKPLDYAKDYAPIVEKIKAAVRANSSTKAALVSALSLAHFLTEQKQFAQALEVLDIPKYHPDNSDLINGFWLMHRGVTLLESKQFEPAINTYQEVLKAEGLKPFHPEAMLKLGVGYELKGDQAKARETYEKLNREFPGTEAATTAQQYLRLLDLNSQKQG